MAMNISKKTAKPLGAAPAKSGTPAKPKKAAAAKMAKVIDMEPETEGSDTITVSGSELKDIIAANIVLILADIFNGLAASIDPDMNLPSDDDDDEADDEPVKPAKAARAKKAAPVEVDDDDDEEEDEPVKPAKGKKAAPVEEDDEAASDEYDPNPFPKELMEVADEAVEELDADEKSIKSNLSTYLESAPEGAPATVKIKSLFKTKKFAEAWKHLVCLLIDDDENVHEFEDIYMRNEKYVYLGGVEGVQIDDVEGFEVKKGAKVTDLDSGEQSKAPKSFQIDIVLHNPVQDTYFGVNEDSGTAVPVEAAD